MELNIYETPNNDTCHTNLQNHVESKIHILCVQSPRRIFVIVFNEGNFIPILWLQQKP